MAHQAGVTVPSVTFNSFRVIMDALAALAPFIAPIEMPSCSSSFFAFKLDAAYVSA